MTTSVESWRKELSNLRLSTVQAYLCKIQGDLFKLAARRGLDCMSFVGTFMNSATAKSYDSEYDRIQWAGTAYIMEELEDESGGLAMSKRTCDPEIMYWIGYLYRYWHFYTGESSTEIYGHADAAKMAMLYPGYHTVDCSSPSTGCSGPPTKRILPNTPAPGRPSTT